MFSVSQSYLTELIWWFCKVANPQDILIFSKSAKKRQASGGISLYFKRNSAPDICLLRKRLQIPCLFFNDVSFNYVLSCRPYWWFWETSSWGTKPTNYWSFGCREQLGMILHILLLVMSLRTEYMLHQFYAYWFHLIVQTKSKHLIFSIIFYAQIRFWNVLC